VPAHPELVGHLRYRSGQLTDLTCRFEPGSMRHHHPWRQPRMRLRPRPDVTVRRHTPPPTLQHPQPHRTTETRQIAYVDRSPVMRLGPGSAPSTTLNPRERF